MKRISLWASVGLLLCLVGPGLLAQPQKAGTRSLDARPLVRPLTQYHGIDASFVPWYEDAGVEYFDEAGIQTDPIQLLADRGANLLRIRVFVNPPDGHNGQADMLHLAQRAHDAGMDILIDLHYSDSWADPGQQTQPDAWTNLSDAQLIAQVQTYTADIIASLYAQNTPPTMIQLGNEITGGMLWPTGRISINGFTGLATLLNAGIAGVDEGIPKSTPQVQHPQIMIHIDRGGNLASSQWFYDGIIAAGVEFDLIGLSYYPWWHGWPNQLKETIQGVAVRYAKPVMLVEVGYPWSLGWNDNTHNFVGTKAQLVPGFPATPAGQRAFLDMLSIELGKLPDGLGIGWCYWGAGFVADPQTPGSPWENISIFDFDHNLLDAARGF